MELSKIKYTDLFENSRNNVFNFFIEPLVENIIEAEERNKLHIGFFGDRDRENSEAYMSLYLSEALGKIFFYEKCKEEKEFLERLGPTNIHTAFYAYEISRFNADCSLINLGIFDLNSLFIKNPYKLQYQYREGQTNYLVAALLKRKLDHKRSLMYFVLNNLSENFISYASIVKKTIDRLKISKNEIRQKINNLIERYEVALRTNNTEIKRNIETRLDILSKLL